MNRARTIVFTWLFLLFALPLIAQLHKPTVEFSEFSTPVPLKHHVPSILLNEDDNWDAGFREGRSIDGGDVYSIATSGDDTYIAGSFGKVGNITAQNIARWNSKTQSWYTLGAGIEGVVTGIAVKARQVFVCGIITKAGNIKVDNVAMWDEDTKAWSALGTGIPSGLMKAVCVAGDDVYFGGFFSSAFGNNIARWSSSTKQWTPLNGQTDGIVAALLYHNNELFIGGKFNTAAKLKVDHCVRYNVLTSAWQPMSKGVNNAVTSFAAVGDSIIVGGRYAAVNDGSGSARCAIWNTVQERWEPFQNPTAGEVAGISVTGEDIYVAGIDYLDSYHRTSKVWSTLSKGTTGTILSIASNDSIVYLGGKFGGINTQPVSSIGYYSNTTKKWEQLGGGVSQGLVYVQALALSGDRVFVGGSFTKAGGKIVNNIAEWNTTTKEWNSLGTGINGSIFALTVKDDNLYVGGDFSYADTLEASRIARWNIKDKRWTPLKKGIYGSVHALAFNGDNLYVGGAFTRVNDSAAANLAVFDTKADTWSTVGNGITGGSYPIVTAIVADDSNNVYIGGKFSKAGDTVMNNITKWNERSRTWTPLGNGITPFQNQLPVGTVSLSGKSVYVGGTFTTVGNALKANNVAEWNTAESAWKPIGDITGDSTSRVSSLVATNGRLYIGGLFNTANGTKTKNIAVFDSSSIVWSGFGSGAVSYYNTASLNILGIIFALASGDLTALLQSDVITKTDVNAIAVQSNASVATVYTGGLFTETGGKESKHFGIYVDSLKPSAPLEEKVSIYPNPTESRMTFTFDILAPTSARIVLYDLMGREVATPFEDQLTRRGRYSVTWESSLATGIYLACLQTAGGTRVEKVIIGHVSTP
ncbi:MAG: T9SS type A sorting domain-containing protein [Candidatus Kapaibacterium sp.]